MTRWLVTGAAGLLGLDIMAALRDAGLAAAGLARHDLDITARAQVRAAIASYRPDVVINCAAWTAVDEAESHEDEALLVNGHGAHNVAIACAQSGARLMHISTDYVFPGDARQPYAEDAAPGPRTAYGRTKLAGERAVLGLLPDTGCVVRTAWLYGAGGPNFASTMIRLERERATVDVVADQRGQPTWSTEVARQVIALAQARPGAGIYHATSSGQTTWHGFAREIFRLLGADPGRVRATTSDRYPRPARRPSYSVLGHEAWAPAGLQPLGDWRQALNRALRHLTREHAAEVRQQ